MCNENTTVLPVHSEFLTEHRSRASFCCYNAVKQLLHLHQLIVDVLPLIAVATYEFLLYQ